MADGKAQGREPVFAKRTANTKDKSKWIPAFAGMTEWSDPGLRRDDGMEWIPAFAGMTEWSGSRPSPG
jgi:hypothetical protein